MATQWTAGLVDGTPLPAATLNQLGAVSESFTPTWTSSGTQPSLGNGTLTGRYFRIQKLVFVQTLLICNTTTTFGTGEYRFAVPVTARAGLFGYFSVGTVRVYDQSAVTTYYGQASFYASATTYMNAYIGNSLITQTAPMTFASGDEIQMTYWYEAA